MLGQETIVVKSRGRSFVTCPIYYATAEPHIGHIHSTVIGDFFHRWAALCGSEGIFTFGTDEHGQKVVRAATERAFDHPQVLVDEMSRQYRAAFNTFGISMGSTEGARWVRTTWKKHHLAAQHFWRRIEKHISLQDYSGWYSTPDEAFIGEKDIEEKDGKKFNIQNGHELEFVSEMNYIFEYGDFLDEIEAWAAKAINQPDHILKEIQQRRKSGRTQLSISRLES